MEYSHIPWQGQRPHTAGRKGARHHKPARCWRWSRLGTRFERRQPTCRHGTAHTQPQWEPCWLLQRGVTWKPSAGRQPGRSPSYASGDAWLHTKQHPVVTMSCVGVTVGGGGGGGDACNHTKSIQGNAPTGKSLTPCTRSTISAISLGRLCTSALRVMTRPVERQA